MNDDDEPEFGGERNNRQQMHQTQIHKVIDLDDSDLVRILTYKMNIIYYRPISQ